MNQRHRRLPNVDLVLEVSQPELNIAGYASGATLAGAGDHLSGDLAREHAGIEQRTQARSDCIFCDLDIASATLKEADHGREVAALPIVKHPRSSRGPWLP